MPVSSWTREISYTSGMLVNWLVAWLFVTAAAANPTSNVSFGVLEGAFATSATDYPVVAECEAYLGVPYAKAPLGNLRFAAAQDWDSAFPAGFKTALAYGSECPQAGVEGVQGSEDW